MRFAIAVQMDYATSCIKMQSYSQYQWYCMSRQIIEMTVIFALWMLAKHSIKYPDLNSARRLVPHHESLPIPVPPTDGITSIDFDDDETTHVPENTFFQILDKRMIYKKYNCFPKKNLTIWEGISHCQRRKRNSLLHD